MEKQKRLLTVVRWPLGGIRTYMRYVYKQFGSDWKITILAADTQESAALCEDAKDLGAELILAPASPLGFLWVVFKTLAQKRHDIIQSQGYISAITACLANLLFRKPHVLTVHGILEDRLLQGFKGRLKRFVTNWAICSVDVVYAVSEDILAHVREQVPCLARSKAKQVAILNGIEPQMFSGLRKTGEFRRRHGLDDELFLFGFLGRFMPQKGFDKIIEALALMEKKSLSRDYRLLAVGSGDYKAQYVALAKEKRVAHRIVFFAVSARCSWCLSRFGCCGDAFELGGLSVTTNGGVDKWSADHYFRLHWSTRGCFGYTFNRCYKMQYREISNFYE